MLQAFGLAPYIGFTENEVKDLCKEYNRDFEKVKNGTMDIYWMAIRSIIPKQLLA